MRITYQITEKDWLEAVRIDRTKGKRGVFLRITQLFAIALILLGVASIFWDSMKDWVDYWSTIIPGSVLLLVVTFFPWLYGKRLYAKDSRFDKELCCRFYRFWR